MLNIMEKCISYLNGIHIIVIYSVEQKIQIFGIRELFELDFMRFFLEHFDTREMSRFKLKQDFISSPCVSVDG